MQKKHIANLTFEHFFLRLNINFSNFLRFYLIQRFEKFY